jgi:hypothetical protein
MEGMTPTALAPAEAEAHEPMAAQIAAKGIAAHRVYEPLEEAVAPGPMHVS